MQIACCGEASQLQLLLWDELAESNESAVGCGAGQMAWRSGRVVCGGVWAAGDGVWGSGYRVAGQAVDGLENGKHTRR